MHQRSNFQIQAELPKRIRSVFPQSQPGGKILKELEYRLAKNRYAVLVGSHGTVKMSLTIEYAYRHRGLYSSIFWLDARNERTLELSFVKVADALREHYCSGSQAAGSPIWKNSPYASYIQKITELPTGTEKIPLRETDHKIMVQAALNWFHCPENKDWLLIYHNVKDSKAPFLQEYLPDIKTIASKRGYVLIASRRDTPGSPTDSQKLQVRVSNSHVSTASRRDTLDLPTDSQVRPLNPRKGFGPISTQRSQTAVEVKKYFADPIDVEEFGPDVVAPWSERSKSRTDLAPEEIRSLGKFAL
jgi:hypothetical protein